jgi:hypothetical protein
MKSIDQSTIFIDHIRKHVSRYYHGFVSDQVYVHLVDKQERRTALLYRFKVSNSVETRSVFVKVPFRLSPTHKRNESVYEKPLLYPKADPHDMHRLHYSALKAIHEYFTCLNKKNLGAIQVLDYLPEYSAIFTEESSDPKLRQLLYRKNRLQALFHDDELAPAFQNAGAWLKAYHEMPKEKDVHIRHSHLEDYVEAISKLNSFLTRILGDGSYFKKISSIIIHKAQEILPESLPLGLGHGDFALRNILISPNARVTVLDTFAKWRTPIYEDIGYFLNDLQMSYPQVISHGLAFSSKQLASYEQAFLKGYFDQKLIPYPAIRLYEILALLDKCSSTIARSYQQPNSIKVVCWLKNKLTSQYYKRRVKYLLAELTNC